MSKATRKETENFVVNYSCDGNPSTQERKEVIFRQLVDLQVDAQEEKKLNSFRFQMLTSRKMSPLKYWQTTGIQYWPELANIALRVFHLSPSSTSCERNFSAFGFIHSKLRNKLSPASVEKLVYIKFNYTSEKSAS